MDRNVLSHRRALAGRHSAKPPVRIARGKARGMRTPEEDRQRKSPRGRVEVLDEGQDATRRPRRADVGPDRLSIEKDANARAFTVANVGAGGTLYLKPSRTPLHFAQQPETPPATANGQERDRAPRPGARQSTVSGTWTPRPTATKLHSHAPSIPTPPSSLTNKTHRRRARSHSCSTISDRGRPGTLDSNDFHILVNGRETGQRPKSSIDLSEGLLEFKIPHHRLGTPRFSERGTAYLHNSFQVSSTHEDSRSSVSAFSRKDYDKLFPAPPGRAHGGGYLSQNMSSSYLHPSMAAHSMPPTRPTSMRSVPPKGVEAKTEPIPILNPAIYDRMEWDPDDPSVVRYHPSTGQIVAATPARLIAQITSPLFLDYELLSDFFLSFRSFMPCEDVLECLFSRMKWALATTTDAGRIVGVRTFVALRHWILNYFADDFATDLGLQQRFCDLVNGLERDLHQRSDYGSTDMNMIGELKKCWRRTCATFWPSHDALGASSEAAIFPGGIQVSDNPGAARPTSPLPFEPRTLSRGPRTTEILLPQVYHQDERTHGESSAQSLERNSTTMTMRTVSIPASPMSEQSLQILSCSVPFLRKLKSSDNRGGASATRTTGAPGILGASGDRPLSPNYSQAARHHKRTGSFSDALRDMGPALSSTKPGSADISPQPVVAFTGGLVRGLLLSPSPANVESVIPLSPSLESSQGFFSDAEINTSKVRHVQGSGVKKIVGDVRRVLGNRRSDPESPTRSYRSSGSRSSQLAIPTEKPTRPPVWQHLQGLPRIDLLGVHIEESYANAFGDAVTAQGSMQHAHPDTYTMSGQGELYHREPYDDYEPGSPQQFDRLNSRVTAGSRSIVIMDDTGTSSLPLPSGGLSPSFDTMSSDMAPRSLFRSPQQESCGTGKEGTDDTSLSERVASKLDKMSSFRPSTIQDLLPEAWTTAGGDEDGHLGLPTVQARKSSCVHPTDLQLSPLNNQLRRRPGGDLKAADTVNDLGTFHRPLSSESSFTAPRSFMACRMASQGLSGSHFSVRQVLPGQRASQKVFSHNPYSVQLLETHSSQTNLRPSFQVQVSRLATMSNASHAGGGVEDALMKLEGKIDSPTESSFIGDKSYVPLNQTQSVSEAPRRMTTSILSPHAGNDANWHFSDSIMIKPSPDVHISAAPDLPTAAEASQFPLQRSRSGVSVGQAVGMADTAEMSDVFWNIGKIRPPSSAPETDRLQGSFLLDDTESLSDISTALGDHPEDESIGVHSFFFDDTADDVELMAPAFLAPPTPPSTVSISIDQSPTQISSPRKILHEAISAPKLLSPNLDKFPLAVQHLRPDLTRAKTLPPPPTTAHLPFVLAFESEVIAEQLAIIEKDALDEVDWKDLIGLIWHQSPPPVQNWVDYLQYQDSNGIDIVVARFNLVVRWVVSECVLTDVPSERARCITKFIHIASHCHRLRNYASLYQITLALLSSDLARLHRTWALVGPAEKQLLKQLEKLCQPLRNFQNLRSEMEASSPDEGCIPFIGLYTHDLMLNAQKPARLDPTPSSTEPLVNFERYQTAAMIVKSVLRLVEASSNYVLHPHPEVLSRCLWLAALANTEISARSMTLEI